MSQGPDSDDANTVLANTVLAIVAELSLAGGSRMVEPAAGESAATERGIDHDRWFAALVELRRRELVQLATAEPSQVVLVALTNAGLMHHLDTTRSDVPELRRRLIDTAAAAAGQGALPLADTLGERALVVECLLDELVGQRQLTYSKAPGRRFRIHRILTEQPGPPPGTR